MFSFITLDCYPVSQLFQWFTLVCIAIISELQIYDSLIMFNRLTVQQMLS